MAAPGLIITVLLAVAGIPFRVMAQVNVYEPDVPAMTITEAPVVEPLNEQLLPAAFVQEYVTVPPAGRTVLV